MSGEPVVRVVRRRAADLRAGGVAVRLPQRVLVPVPADLTADGRVRGWRWQVCQAADLPGVTSWRYLYEVGLPAGEGLQTLRDGLGDGFTALRVSADQPGAGVPVAPLIVAVGASDLLEVQQVDIGRLDVDGVGIQRPADRSGVGEPVVDRYTLVGVWRDGAMLPVGIVPGEAEVRTVDEDEPVWTLAIRTVPARRRGDGGG